jgi:hypothetical protein
MLRLLTRLGSVVKTDFPKINWPEIIFDRADKDALERCGFSSISSSAFTVESAEGQFVIAPSQYILFSIYLKEFVYQISDYLEVVDKLRRMGQQPAAEAIFRQDSTLPEILALDEYSRGIFYKPLVNEADRLGAKEILTKKSGVLAGVRTDFLSSIVLNCTNLIAVGSGMLPVVILRLKENREIYDYFEKKYISKISYIRSGNAINAFVYSVLTFLYHYDGLGAFFSLLRQNSSEHDNFSIEDNGFKLTSIFRLSDRVLSINELSMGNHIRFFEDPIFNLNGKYYYLSTQWTAGTESRLDLNSFERIIAGLYPQFGFSLDSGRYYLKSHKTISASVGNSMQSSYLSKPFILLPGISGTGKSRFVRMQSNDLQSLIVPVRPDWHEPSDLLGYVSRIGGRPEYVATDTLRFMAKAWKDAYSNASAEGIVLKPASEMATFWLCLDEMNLAPVEQYFADYLSVLESRKWDGGPESYKCDPILRIPDGVDNIRAVLGLEASEFEDLWSYFNDKGMPLPPNLIVAGTVNMDETTHGFSRKVIDRALTFDFGDFFPNDFGEYFVQSASPVKLGFPTRTHIDDRSQLAGAAADNNGEKSIAFLSQVNDVLKGTSFELAYRALNELLLSVHFHGPSDDAELQAVWDDYIMMKVLPRIEGDNEKLASRIEADANVIELLERLLTPQFIGDDGKERVDFYRVDTSGQRPKIRFRSIRKLQWMQQRLRNNGFTSFWP